MQSYKNLYHHLRLGPFLPLKQPIVLHVFPIHFDILLDLPMPQRNPISHRERNPVIHKKSYKMNKKKEKNSAQTLTTIHKNNVAIVIG